MYLKIHSADEDVKTYFKLKYENMYNKRKDAILYPHNNFKDENVGGGRSNSNVTKEEVTAINLADDKALLRYNSILEDIDPLYNKLEDYEKEILKAYYLDASRVRNRRRTNEYVFKKLKRFTKDEITTTRSYFLKIVALKRGLLEYD